MRITKNGVNDTGTSKTSKDTNSLFLIVVIDSWYRNRQKPAVTVLQGASLSGTRMTSLYTFLYIDFYVVTPSVTNVSPILYGASNCESTMGLGPKPKNGISPHHCQEEEEQAQPSWILLY